MQIDLDKEEINYLLIAVKEMDKRVAEMKEKHNWDFEKEIKSYAKNKNACFIVAITETNETEKCKLI